MPLLAVTQPRSFMVEGKKTAWDVWSTYDPVTLAFKEIMNLHNKRPADAILSAECFSHIERFIVLLYDRTNPCEKVSCI